MWEENVLQCADSKLKTTQIKTDSCPIVPLTPQTLDSARRVPITQITLHFPAPLTGIKCACLASDCIYEIFD